MKDASRNVFGALAFVVAAFVIAAVLSPYVPIEKESVANVILGNVLGWPMMVLAYHYGTNASSARKTELMIAAGKDDATNVE
jgi:cobalamin synthase